MESSNLFLTFSNAPLTAGLKKSVTGMRGKAVPLPGATGLPKDSKQGGRFPDLTHDETNESQREDFRCLRQSGQTISQLSGKNIAAAFLAFYPNIGVTDEWPQENRRDY